MNDVRLPRPTPREDFRKRLRSDLMNEAVALAEERRARRRSFAERLATFLAVRMRPIAVAATIVAILLAGSGAAAAGSLPGDPAFGLKRAVEAIEVALAPSEEAKVRVLAVQTERRLEDLTKSASRPDKAPTASAEYEAAVQRLAAAVAALRTAAPDAKREAVEEVVEAARDKHVQVLETLRERLPEGAQEGLERATEQHDKIKERGPKDEDRPGNAPSKEDARQSDRPRASESPRGGRPSVQPTPRTK